MLSTMAWTTQRAGGPHAPGCAPLGWQKPSSASAPNQGDGLGFCKRTRSAPSQGRVPGAPHCRCRGWGLLLDTAPTVQKKTRDPLPGKTAGAGHSLPHTHHGLGQAVQRKRE